VRALGAAIRPVARPRLILPRRLVTLSFSLIAVRILRMTALALVLLLIHMRDPPAPD
jgi:hypothetical protein